MSKKKKKKECWDCAYRENVPGHAHINCVYKWLETDLVAPEGNPHGIAKGWYIFPALFDPVWMLEECPAWSTEREKGKWGKIDPFVMMAGILGSVGRKFG